jgi:hypothetical protein
MSGKENHIYATVKVGDRGQIVIPSEARKDFNIKPGDLLGLPFIQLMRKLSSDSA